MSSHGVEHFAGQNTLGDTLKKNHRERIFFGKFIERTTKIKVQRGQIR
jgi:hypothetical protein